jgi:osmoprotectant transport system permease protein
MTAMGQGVPGGRGWVRNRVLGLLVIGAIGAALSLAFVTVAPNRLVSGSAVALQSLMVAAPWGLWAAAAVLVIAVFVQATRLIQVAVALAAALLFAGGPQIGGLAGAGPGVAGRRLLADAVDGLAGVC